MLRGRSSYRCVARGGCRHQHFRAGRASPGRYDREVREAGRRRQPRHRQALRPRKFMNRSLIQGIIPPMVTPFSAEYGIDERAHRAEVRHLIDTAGVHGVAVCGSTGEGHTLTTDETRRITAWAIEEARGHVPVITGIIADSTRAAIERAKAVADLGVAALQVTPVHYVFRPDDDSMLGFFSDIAEADGVIGVKQSASDMKALADLLLLTNEAGLADRVRILSAVDALLYPSFQLGSHGAVA